MVLESFFFSVIRHMLKGFTVNQTKANNIVCKCDFQCLIFKLSLRQRFYLFMLASVSVSGLE